MTIRSRLNKLEGRRRARLQLSFSEILRRLQYVLDNPQEAARYLGREGVARVQKLVKLAQDRRTAQ